MELVRSPRWAIRDGWDLYRKKAICLGENWELLFGGGTGQGTSGHSEGTEHAQEKNSCCRRVFL